MELLLAIAVIGLAVEIIVLRRDADADRVACNDDWLFSFEYSERVDAIETALSDAKSTGAHAVPKKKTGAAPKKKVTA